MTTLGRRPYVKVYVNIDEILALAVRYIEKRLPEETVFEGAATSDPVPVEPYTGSLKTTIEFFAQHKSGRFRFVTKFTDISSLLDARHARQSQVRFSINSEDVIAKHEAGVPRLSPRLAAAKSVAQAGYPVGFMVAPVILAPGWEWGYEALFSSVAKAVEEEPSLGTCTLEFVTHRFTRTGKARINEVFPDSGLPLDECGRTFKFGQFGYGKYVYPKETMQSLEAFFQRLKEKYLPRAQWLYLV
jgi:spore photoproduct lyase